MFMILEDQDHDDKSIHEFEKDNLERKPQARMESISHLVVRQTFLIKNHLASYFIITAVKEDMTKQLSTLS